MTAVRDPGRKPFKNLNYQIYPTGSPSGIATIGPRFRLCNRSRDQIMCRTAMTIEELHTHIWIDPARCGGRPCIRGHRICVSMVLDLLADGVTPQQIIAGHYPQITVADIHACIAYGSAMSHERYVAVALEPVA